MSDEQHRALNDVRRRMAALLRESADVFDAIDNSADLPAMASEFQAEARRLTAEILRLSADFDDAIATRSH